MKNITLLVLFIIAISFWLSDYLFLGADSRLHEKNEVNLIDLKDVTVKQFNIEQLAKTLGVDFSRIESEEEKTIEDTFEIEVSLISIHTSGDFAKARLRIKNSDNKNVIVDAVLGESFHSLELTAITPTYVELVNNKNVYLLKMFKAQKFSITRTNTEEDDLDDQ